MERSIYLNLIDDCFIQLDQEELRGYPVEDVTGKVEYIINSFPQFHYNLEGMRLMINSKEDLEQKVVKRLLKGESFNEILDELMFFAIGNAEYIGAMVDARHWE